MLPLYQALMERDEAQRKAQDLLAQHERDVAEMEDLRAQLAKVDALLRTESKLSYLRPCFRFL